MKGLTSSARDSLGEEIWKAKENFLRKEEVNNTGTGDKSLRSDDQRIRGFSSWRHRRCKCRMEGIRNNLQGGPMAKVVILRK